MNAACVPLCLCECWSQQERAMYYSHMSNSVVVRQCGAALKVTDLPVAASPLCGQDGLSCTEVSNLSFVHEEKGRDRWLFFFLQLVHR